jgi:hypothetical protein
MKRSTWSLLILVVALVSGIFFWEKKQPSTHEKSENEGKIFASFPKKIVRIERTGPESVTLEKIGDDWFIKKPFYDPAENSSAESYIETLKGAKAYRLIKEQPSPEKLGLAIPKLRIVLSGDMGEQLALELGNSPPLEKGAYFRAGGKAGIIDDYLLETINRKTGDFRSRELASPLKPSDVKSITHIKDGKIVSSLQNRGGKFYVVKPYEDEADENKAYFFIEDVVLWPVMAFDGEMADPASVGLAFPKETIEIGASGGKKITVALGDIQDKEKNFYYASVSSRKGVFTVSKNSARFLDKDPEEMRSLSVFPRDLYTAEKVEIAGTGKTVLSNTKEKSWQIEGQTGRDEDARTVVYALTDLKGEKPLAIDEGGKMFATISAFLHAGRYEVRLLDKDGRLYAISKDRKIMLLISREDGERLKAAFVKLEEKNK